jgi:hypothetical protein
LPISKNRSSEIEKLVDQILDLNNQLLSEEDKVTDDSNRLREQIGELDRKVDGIVFEIYGLDNNERILIEDSLLKD